MDKCIVYTALTGKYFLNTMPISENVKYIAYREDGIKLIPPWQGKKLKRKGHPKTDIAEYKICPHRFFDCEYSIWLDSMIVAKTGQLLKTVEEYILKNGDIAFWKHPTRKHVYEEAVSAIENKKYKDKVGTIRCQMDRYINDGMPRNVELLAGGIIIRRHTKEVNEFNECWYREFLKGSRCDQLSLSYTAWKTKIPIIKMNDGIVHENSFFHYVGGKITVDKNGQRWWVGREQ